MGDATMNAREKLDEACFFLRLMDKIEMDRSSLTNERPPEKEFAYLLSALLGACYSSIEHLARERLNEPSVVSFKRSHPEFYKSGASGGWRTQAVHFRPVNPQHDGYIPPPGNNVILRFRKEAEPIRDGAHVELRFGSGRFYFSPSGPQNSICDLCSEHILQIQKLIDACA